MLIYDLVIWSLITNQNVLLEREGIKLKLLCILEIKWNYLLGIYTITPIVAIQAHWRAQKIRAWSFN